MSFDAGSIMGRMGLDESPAIKSLRNFTDAAHNTKLMAEKSLGAIDMSTVSKQLEAARKGFESPMKSAGFFDSVAEAAKKFRRDDRLSGEIALGSFATRGAAGLADFGLSAAGLGGPAIMIEGIARGLNSSIKMAKELAGEYGKGNINAADMAMSVGKSLPVLGAVFELGENINDMWTGNKSAIEANATATQHFSDQMSSAQKWAEAVKASTGGFSEQIRNINVEIEKMVAEMQNMPTLAAAIGGKASIQSALDAASTNYKNERQKLLALYTADGDGEGKGQSKLRSLQAELAKLPQSESFNPMAEMDFTQAAKARESSEAANRSIAQRRKEINEQITLLEDRKNTDLLNLEKKYQENIAAIQKKGNLDAQKRAADSATGSFSKQLSESLANMGKSPEDVRLAELKRMPDIGSDVIRNLESQMQALSAARAQASIGDIQKQVDQFNMDGYARMIDDAKRNPIFKTGDIDKMVGVVNSLKDLDANKKIKEQVDAFRDSLTTPLEAFQKKVDHLAEWEHAGRITASEFDRGVANARLGLNGTSDQLPQFIRANSYEQTVAKFEAANQTNVDRTAERTAKATEDALPILQAIERKASEQQPDVVGVLPGAN